MTIARRLTEADTDDVGFVALHDDEYWRLDDTYEDDGPDDGDTDDGWEAHD